MPETEQVKVPFLALNDVMNDEYWIKVVRRALDFRKSPACTQSKRLNLAIVGNVKVNGFPDPRKAPTAKLAPPVLEESKCSNELMGAILVVWAESQPDLRSRVQAFAIRQNIPTIDPCGLAEGFPDALWPESEMSATAEAFRKDEPDANEDDVCLMLCCITGRALISDERLEQLVSQRESKPTPESLAEPKSKSPAEPEPESPAAPKSPAPIALRGRCKAWLDELSTLPWDAPEWLDLPIFIEELSKLRDLKLAEYGRHLALKQALAQFNEGTSDGLVYFDIQDAARWTPEGFDPTEAAAIIEELNGLKAALLKRRDLVQTRCTTLAEEDMRHHELVELGKTILQQYRHVAVRWQPPSVNPPIPAPVEPSPTLLNKDHSVTSPPPAEPSVVVPPTAEVTPSVEPRPVIPSSEEVSPPAALVPSPDAQVQRALEPQPVEPMVEASARQEPVASEVAIDLSSISVETPEIETVPTRAESAESAIPPVPEIDSDVEQAFWRFVADDDLPAAYWLSRSVAQSGSRAPVPEWLVAAVQGARWLTQDSDLFITDLLDIAKSEQPADHDLELMLGLAASLRTTLIAPASGLLGWLRAPTCLPHMHNLVKAVDDFASNGVALRPEDLRGVTGFQERQEILARQKKEVRNWLDTALERNTHLGWGTDVWRQLVGTNGELRIWLTPIVQNDLAHYAQVQEQLRHWQSHDYVKERIDRIQRENQGRKGKRIEGTTREHLLREIAEICQLVGRWCDLAVRETRLQTEGNWVFDQVAKLCANLQSYLPEAEAELVKFVSSDGSFAFAASGLCLRRTIGQLRQTLDLPAGPRELETVQTREWKWLVSGAADLTAALNRRLLCLPEIALEADGQPSPASVPVIASALTSPDGQANSPRRAVEARLDREDYAFVPIILESLGDQDRVELSNAYQERLEGSRLALADEIARVDSEIEQAVVDGVFAEDQRADYSQVLGIEPDKVLNFHAKFKMLEEVCDKLAAAREKRLEELKRLWNELRPKLAGRKMQEQQKQITDMINAALERQDTRVLEECLANLREALETGGEIKDWSGKEDESEAEYLDSQQRFFRLMPTLEQMLIHRGLPTAIDAISDRKDFAELSFRRLVKERLNEAVKALEAWRQMKQNQSGDPNLKKHLETILRFLGFRFDRENEEYIRVEQEDDFWTYCQATMSANVLLTRPFPQFGSQTQSLYHVVCVWEKPSVDTMSAWIHDLRLETRNLLVLYLGRMSVSYRAVVGRAARENRLDMAVLDELLMVFLCAENHARLPVFLRCALPFSAVNPYTPFQAGDVPPEMFYGRKAMADELMRSAGSCLVYGGRQLGKSALLRHVQRQFHDPGQNQYAWVENIKLIFDPQNKKTALGSVLRSLRDAFKREGLIPATVRTDRPEDIIRHLCDALKNSPGRRVLVMFDEADDLLDADAQDGFRVIVALRELMTETGRRFKLVFAGLHNVQRFQGIPNQPLAHFGAPLCVGPLEPDAAQKLVRQPLQALGYQFSDNAAMLRILSYTNYHPGLIQLYCSELLKRFHARVESSSPPFAIEQTDVEAVYRAPANRKNISDRFDWTLALDTRYQAIAWSMIFDQMETRDSYARSYSPSEILAMVRYCWPQGFDRTLDEELRGLLDEMCGLGVLVRNEDGHYRLRSPNLVRLMGTDTEILRRLDALREKQPPEPFEANHHHAWLDEKGHTYSPLTYAQETRLNPQHSGVGLIFASAASGLTVLPNAIRRFAAQESLGSYGRFATVPPWIKAGERLPSWLESEIQAAGQCEYIVILGQPVGATAEELVNLVESAQSFCEKHGARRKVLRIVFLLDPPATFTWLRQDPGRRTALEERLDAAITPRRWNITGLRPRMMKLDKMATDEICQCVLQVTGGWAHLLDRLLERAGKNIDVRPAVEQMERELLDLGQPLAVQFRETLGIQGNEIARRTLEFIAQEKQVTAEFVTPVMLGGQPDLSTGECSQALEYLLRMGLVDQQGDVLTVEPVAKRVLFKP